MLAKRFLQKLRKIYTHLVISNKLKIIGYILTFLLGIFAFWLQQKISAYLEKPEVSAQLRGIVLIKQNNNWEFTSYIRLINSGKTTALIQYGDAELDFSRYSRHLSRPMNFRFNKFINLIGNTIIDDTLSTYFPAIFDTIYHDVPHLDKGHIKLEKPNGSLMYFIEFDSTDVLYSMNFFEYVTDLTKLKGARVDSARNQLGLAVRRIYIDYKGKTYLNFVYPNHANVSYEVIDNKIKLKYFYSSGEITLVSKASSMSLFEPILFLPDSSIADKISYPKKIECTLSIAEDREGKTVYDFLKLYLGTDARQIVYLFANTK